MKNNGKFDFAVPNIIHLILTFSAQTCTRIRLKYFRPANQSAKAAKKPFQQLKHRTAPAAKKYRKNGKITEKAAISSILPDHIKQQNILFWQLKLPLKQNFFKHIILVPKRELDYEHFKSFLNVLNIGGTKSDTSIISELFSELLRGTNASNYKFQKGDPQRLCL